MDQVIQFEGTIYENGYGLLAQKVMRDKDLPKQSKLIYAYMCSFAGVSKNGERTAFPSVSLQCSELGMNEDTYYKWRKNLIEFGYIKITKQRSNGAKFDRNLYSIIAVPKEVVEAESTENQPYPNSSGTVENASNQGFSPYPNSSGTEKPGTEKPGTEKPGTNSNRFTINSSNKDLDTLDTKTGFYKTENNNYNASEKERYLIDSFFENDIIPVKIAKCLRAFSRTLEEAEHFSQIIFRAKKVVELELNIVIWLDNEEEVENVIINSFTRALRKVNKESVKNPDGYIYKSIQGGLNSYFNTRLPAEQDPAAENGMNGGKEKVVPFYNWLETRS